MKKNIFVFVIFLLISVGSDCFAQSAGVRTRALQGEWFVTSWLLTSMDGISVPEYRAISMVFDGNNYLFRGENFKTGRISIVESGTFRIIADALTLTHQNGVTETGTYTLQGDILTLNFEGSIMILIKR